MKRFLCLQVGLAIMLLSSVMFAQNVADFENLDLSVSSYYDGAEDHSGTLDVTEVFSYTSGGIDFSINYTEWTGGYTSWGGMAYSNQTDLTTADFTNYSAYTNPVGGNNSSENYGLFYPSWGVSDSISFQNIADLSGMYIANYVWTYHYIMGSDGVGSGTYEDGDYLTLTIFAYGEDNIMSSSIEVSLADYTNSNTDVISQWTWVDLSSLQNVKYIKFALTSSDSWTPTYFCVDDISYSLSTNIDDNRIVDKGINIYPNPCNNYLNVENLPEGIKHIEIYDITGKIVFQQKSVEKIVRVNTSELSKGVYFLHSTVGKESYDLQFIK